MPLINDAWARSGECKDEFNLAKRLNLTSTEMGRTREGDPRLPVILPIAFSDLDWDAHSHVQLLAASTNFLVHGTKNLEAGDFEATCRQVAVGLIRQGNIIVEGFEQDAQNYDTGKEAQSGALQLSAAMGEQLALESAQAQLAVVQRHLAHAREQWEIKQTKEKAAVLIFPVEKLGRGYVGTAITTVGGCRQAFTVDFRWLVAPLPKDGAPTQHELQHAVMIATPVGVSRVVDTESAKEREAMLTELIKLDAKAAVTMVGGYSSATGVVVVDGKGFMSDAQYEETLRVEKGAQASSDTPEMVVAMVEVELRKAALGSAAKIVWPLCEYRMLLSTDGSDLLGVLDRPPESGKDEDRLGVPKWSAPLRLRRYA
mmetsp:Transcript_45449/g.106283  ORF Transcript_45449/g.106283 Transcript_45449/m.106283 type:complete len:371 (+) Transcript_45449:170-1282(+)